METIDPSDSVNMSAQGTSGVTSGRSAEEDLQRSATDRILSEQTRSVALRWLLHDIPYIAMLFLVLVGVVFTAAGYLLGNSDSGFRLHLDYREMEETP